MLEVNKIVFCVTIGFFIHKLFVRGAPSMLSNEQIENDDIVSTVVDMNSSNTETSAIFNQFNISREDVERRRSQINDSETESDSQR